MLDFGLCGTRGAGERGDGTENGALHERTACHRHDSLSLMSKRLSDFLRKSDVTVGAFDGRSPPGVRPSKHALKSTCRLWATAPWESLTVHGRTPNCVLQLLHFPRRSCLKGAPHKDCRAWHAHRVNPNSEKSGNNLLRKSASPFRKSLSQVPFARPTSRLCPHGKRASASDDGSERSEKRASRCPARKRQRPSGSGLGRRVTTRARAQARP